MVAISAPAIKPFPTPVMISALTSASETTKSNVESISSINWILRAFNALGRLTVKIPTLASFSKITNSQSMRDIRKTK